MTTTNFASSNNITTFSGASGAGAIADNDDNVHTGIVKVLEAYARGNYMIEYGNLRQGDAGTYTRFDFDGAVKFYREGKLYTQTPTFVEMTAPHGTDTRYDMLVIATSNNLAIRVGTATATPTIAALTAGDIPVALIKVVGGSGAKPIDRPMQLYSFNKDENSTSIAYNGGGTTYTETANIIGAAGGTTITNSIGDFIIDNTDTNDQIVLRLGDDTSATGFEVRNNSDVVLFQVDSSGAVEVTAGTFAVAHTPTVKTVSSIVTLVNKTNAVDMDGTGSSINWNQWYYDGTPAVDDAGKIVVATETDWTATAGTRQSYMSFWTSNAGTLHEYFRIKSGGEWTCGLFDASIESAGNFTFIIDVDDDETGQYFEWKNDTTQIMVLAEDGDLQIDGDLTVTGNGITFGNGATITNPSTSSLLLTEAVVNASAAVVAATTVTGATGIETDGYNKVGHAVINVSAGPAQIAAAAADRVYYLHTCAGGTLQLPDPTASAGRIITLKNIDQAAAVNLIPTAGVIEGGVVIPTGDRTVAPPPFLALVGPNTLTLEPHMSITLHAVTDAAGGLVTGWYILE